MAGDSTAGFGSAELDAFAQSLSRLTAESGEAWAGYLSGGPLGNRAAELPANLAAAAAAFASIAERLSAEPARADALQSAFVEGFQALWAQLQARLDGKAAEPAREFPPDARFADPEWGDNPYFDFLRRTHLLARQWTEGMLDCTPLDAVTRARAGFYTRELLNAVSPSNFVLTNPVLLRETLESGGANLMRGAQRFSEDLQAAGGEVHVRHAEEDHFRLGTTLAATPGKVVFRNALMELIQYAPATPLVRKRPLLIVPPWINKFYILDLAPGKSFIEWAVAEGQTVFCISWVNPGAELRDMSFADYAEQGVRTALDIVQQITRAEEVDALGYCIGGTLLAATTAVMRAEGDRRVASLTLLAAQLDFRDAGELQLFIDEPQLAYIERSMAENGYMDGRVMARVFNHLRSDELVWPYLVDAYVRGKPPARFDILYWNGDTTRVPEANHAFYLRHCYLENALATGRMPLGDAAVDLAHLDVPVYAVAAAGDHIAPASSVFTGVTLLPGPVRFALSGSGHISGIVNPPSRQKYGFRVGAVQGTESFSAWRQRLAEQTGSWWPDWRGWLDELDAETVKARRPGSRKYKPLEDAPGAYVHVR